MWKTRGLFKKVEDVEGTCYSRMGMIKDRNTKDLTEVEEIKKRWQKYTEDWNKKGVTTRIAMIVWSLTMTTYHDSAICVSHWVRFSMLIYLNRITQSLALTGWVSKVRFRKAESPLWGYPAVSSGGGSRLRCCLCSLNCCSTCTEPPHRHPHFPVPCSSH